MRHNAITVNAILVCLSVTPGILSKWLNLRSQKQRHTIAPGLGVAKDLREIRSHPLWRHQTQVG